MAPPIKNKPARTDGRECSLDGCHDPLYARGLCIRHYQRLCRNGAPTASKPRPRREPILRFTEKYDVDPNTGCWLWRRPSNYGYGAFDGQQAHRWSYEHFVGPIPEGMEIDHACHTNDPTCGGGDRCEHRRCVNPTHLEPVTPAENVRRGLTRAAGKRPCPCCAPDDPKCVRNRPRWSRQ